MSGDHEEMSPLTVRRYHAFLLRLWQDSPAGPWRVSLQDAATHQQRAFADLEQLVDFLHDLVEGSTEAS